MAHLTREHLVGEPPTDDARRHDLEPGRVVRLPLVVSEGLLVEVAVKVERLSADVRAREGAP